MIALSHSNTAAFSLNILSRIDLTNPEPQVLARNGSQQPSSYSIVGIVGQFRPSSALS
jgi:hypothetical protein